MNLNLDEMNVTQFLHMALSHARINDTDKFDYMFELGIGVVHKIISEDNYMFVHNINGIDTLWDIPVRVNYQNPFEFRLWKDATND